METKKKKSLKVGGEDKKQTKSKTEKNHKNFKCRNCGIVDGYTEKETNCRYCGTNFFVIDVI